jgi:hypothetical protein
VIASTDPGPFVIIVIMLIMMVGLLISGAVLAGIVGWAATDDAERRYAGSELIDLNQ